MVSRDTTAHIAAVLLGFVALSLVSHYGIGPETDTIPIIGFLLFYGLVLGGSHLYLAVRGEDGLIPVEARWRYVATLAVLLGIGTVITYVGERTIASVSLGTVGLVAILLGIVVYVLAESIAGYRSTRSE